MERLWQQITSFTADNLGVSAESVEKILWTVAILAGFFAIRWLLVRITTRRIADLARKYVVAKTLGYALGLLTIVALIRIWAGGLAGMATYLGILSAGLAIALQDTLASLVGWLYIFVRKPFVTGDRIQIGQHAGDIIDISLFQFTLVEIGNWVDADQSTGRVIHVPNNWVFKHPMANYTQGFNLIWNELPVTVTFESNWIKAKEILNRLANEHSVVKSEHAAKQIREAASKFLIFYQHLTPIIWTSVQPNGVTLTIRYLCTPRSRRSSASRIWEEILREFSKCPDIDLAYPTTRIFRGPSEATDEVRPSPASPAWPTNQPLPPP